MLRKMFAILCLVSLTVSCGGGGDADSRSGEPVRGVTDTEIIIGSHEDLSGPVALLGTEIVYGARLRFEQANSAGGIHGRQINFIVEDAQYQVPRAIQATNKLVNRDNIFMMILGMGTPMNTAVMQTLFDA
ncbi:MAG: ABC transporter substrate-binding protein, partial [Candidatus Rariloculaceae bacterium]